jgi:hypothetical protein
MFPPSILCPAAMSIGFSLEFKRWYVIIRGPKGRPYCGFGFAKNPPVFF